jgi:eukaryotic-like serine/threonine-protein kinase
VRGTLGESVDADTVRALAERADGNAFYLEELIRAVSARAGAASAGELPETVLAMVQARLEGLDPEARRVLRAASVFGQRFWRGGVAALSGGAAADAWLPALAEDEVISVSREARFPGEVEYAFRHALVRDAAYGMLTAEDGAKGHRLAAAWLEEAGEGDAMVLAEHYEHGGDRPKAAQFYLRAAQQAFEGDDLELAFARAERGVAAAGPGSDAAGAMYLLQAQADRWRGLHRDALARALKALSALPRGTAAWWDAAAEVVSAANTVPDPLELDATSKALLAAPFGDGPAPLAGELAVAAAVALARASVANFYGGRYPTGEALLARSEIAARACAHDPSASAHVDCARGIHALLAGDVSGYLDLMRSAGAGFEQAGDARSACVQTMRVGDAYMQLGVYGAAERAFRGTVREAEQLGLGGQRAAARINLGLSLALQGKAAEGASAVEEGLALAQGDHRFDLTARIYLARIRLASDPTRAVREIRSVSDDPAVPPAYRSYALAIKAAARLALGDPERAVRSSRHAMDLLGSLGEIEEGGAFIHLAHAEALLASGEAGAARTAAAAGRARLLGQAEKIADAALRRSFLERVPENARLLDLASRLLRLDAPRASR